jgi:hypothetical protein
MATTKKRGTVRSGAKLSQSRPGGPTLTLVHGGKRRIIDAITDVRVLVPYYSEARQSWVVELSYRRKYAKQLHGVIMLFAERVDARAAHDAASRTKTVSAVRTVFGAAMETAKKHGHGLQWRIMAGYPAIGA